MHVLRCERSTFFCEKCNRALPKSERETHDHCPRCNMVVAPAALEKHISIVHTKVSLISSHNMSSYIIQCEPRVSLSLILLSCLL